MTEGINNTGSAHHTQQPILDPGTISGKQKVSGGQLDGKDFTVSSRNAAEGAIVSSRNEMAPQLETPSETSLPDLEFASAQVAQISKHIEESMKSTHALLANIVSGEVSPEQAARLQQHAASLLGTSEYLDNLRGEGLQTMGGKQNILAALGFSDSQIDALLSMANPEDQDNTLSSLHQSGAGAKEMLKAQGFQQQQIDKLLSLPNGTFDSNEFSEQVGLLQKMGFSDVEAATILSASDSLKVKEQKMLLESNTTEQREFLTSAGNAFNQMSVNQVFAPQILEQLVDMFAVMELIHKMSVEQRRTARESRSLNYESAKQQILSQAEKMKEAAVKTAIGGYISAGTKVAAGVFQGAYAVKSGYAPNDGVRQQQVAIGNALSSITQASGEVGKTAFDYQATMHQAEIK
ncbi:MAG: hypothetical protein ACPGEF_00820, partial [Endozoicomonas sp.]